MTTTASKRFSMLTWGQGTLSIPYPAAAETLDDKQVRQTMIGEYGGFDLGPRGTTPSTDPDPGLLFWGSRRPRRITV